MTTFPSDWPGDCPPSDAIPSNVTVYRVVKTSPPSQEDFLTYREMKKPDNGRPCDAASLSVFTNPEDAHHYSEKYPHLGELIASASLTPSHGKFAPSPRKVRGRVLAHASWWAYTGVDRCSLFMVKL